MEKKNKEQSKAIDPWAHHMLNGDYEEAWKVSDEALKSRAGKPCWHWPRHLQYVWDGRSLEGKSVLVKCYHGLGDTIQFIRYIPMVRAVAKEVIVWAQPSLVPLLQTVKGIDRLMPLHDGAPEADYDADVEIMELAHVFRTTVCTVPTAIPYLSAVPVKLPFDQQGLNIGLVWKAGNWDNRRNIPFAQLQLLFDIEGINIYILQAGAKEAGWQEGFGIYPGEFSLETFAGLIRGLDLLISIDSMPVHLAGASAVPVWTLLHADADWRWMRNRSDSPWYPTMRLFRQQQQDDWCDVVESVCTELKNLADLRRKSVFIKERQE